MTSAQIPTALDVKLDNLRLVAEDAEAILKRVLEGIEEIRQGMREITIPLPIVCGTCDAQIESAEKAVQDGWLDLVCEQGLLIGWCADCVQQHEEAERKLNTPPVKTSGMLFETHATDE